jgi:hypothetical protein
LDIDKVLSQQEIVCAESPDVQADIHLQIDENRLTELIVEIYKGRDPYFDETDKEYTIYRDVKSIASVYKLRQGARPIRIHDLVTVFVTTNPAIALASKRFERRGDNDNYFYIPTAITDVFLGTIIWLRSPKIVSLMSEKRLIATCIAALRPNRALVKKLTTRVHDLLQQGEISSDDAMLLTESRMARNLLQEETLGDPTRFTDRTALDILEELRRSIKREERESLRADREQFESAKRELEVTLENRNTEVKDYNTLVTQINRRIGDYDTRIELTARNIARTVAGLFYAVSILYILYITIMQFFPSISPTQKWLNAALIGSAILLAMANIILGVNVKDVGTRIQKALQLKIIALLKP